MVLGNLALEEYLEHAVASAEVVAGFALVSVAS